jgi:uncharacterized membrane protein YdbT with pleckstrin-like domain
MDPQAGERVFFHGHPCWRSMLGLYLKGLAAAVLAGALVGVVSAVADKHVQASWVVAAVLIVFAVGLIRGLLRRARTRYTITDRRLTIERGLLARDLHETTLDRVQNVASRQSMLERMLGVGTVDFDTAGSAEFDFSFTGVEHPRRIVRIVDEALHERLDANFGKVAQR